MDKHIELAINLLKEYEGLSLNTYLDVGGLPTIGYGHLIKENEVIPTNINIEQAEKLLLEDIKPFNESLLSCINIKLNNNQKAAILCLMYNIGEGAFKKSSLLKCINNSSSLDLLEKQWLKWKYVNKKVSKGLLARRKKEFALYCSNN